MARMIPSDIDPHCPSPGEVELFRRLRDDPATADWIVLHSLDVAKHVKQVAGEADFVVIIPGKGVLCLEVKACTRLRREGGNWYYGTNPSPDSRGPFKQASGAMHSIRSRVIERRPHLSRIPFWSAVIFTNVAFSATSPEWHPWQVVDAYAMRSHPISVLLASILDKAREHLASKGGLWFHGLSKEPYIEQGSELAELLRPSFECIEPQKLLMKRLDQEIKQYTEEQFTALDAMTANPRVAFVGPAGSGKTVLAMEAARRSACEGRRVLLLCYNTLLGKRLSEQVKGLETTGNITVSTLHSHMRKVAGDTCRGEGPRFWQTDLPLAATDRLLAEQPEAFLFDEIVMDEAQDLLRPEYLDFLDLSIVGGLAAGRWRLFGDFEKQHIYDASTLTLPNFLERRAPGTSIYSLRINCRNTPRVATYAQYLGGLRPGYSHVRRPDDQIPPHLAYFRDGAQQQQLLVQLLEQLYGQGFRGSDIVVLSTRQDRDSCAAGVNAQPWSSRLRPYDQAGEGYIGYCTIHAFKGLEAPVVVLTDVERVNDDKSVDLLYVGITRSLSRLVILAREPVKEDVIRILTQSTLAS